MNNLIRRVVCMIAFTACFALPALADSTAFTDLGPGGSYDGLFGADISGVSSSNGGPVSWADPFTASIGGTLSQIDLGLTNIGGTNSAVISIYTDVSNNLGTLVFSGNVSNQPAFGSTNTTLATLFPGSGVLVAGDSYFLVVAPGAADAFDYWHLNNVGAPGVPLVSVGSSSFNPTGFSLEAFDVKVNATSVPEPSTWLMLGAELLCLLGAASWKRSVSVR